ncbi:MAG: hypothetical protein JGK17_24765 [Microcoleus sp. PH2017_10_PVI_O_A]|uniref:hypothetical protein n=1 Tax=unclassified Microcoleus TaxID=2642155 RepID=UPI001D849383|nr:MULTISPECIES: hypothetical protein [unclassified Microcoleus]TAE77397.1 MAG: hypothetical protein EAZ83_26585 [Oscillatoriales cyanobacterium]MCC3408728.1 hypothetical protein [Microcoleus sp. PH2017_10_PVI_O_A]MCC3462815.1 hypothetical protein [Microcoleus sp. PH2017_11_PCY_U_A]MCC3481298.1 hypothetical protein [Microcoleus sp. PH2017_12_PCY_D_A]MCC3529507.1 hypothetical protein [Microcoleus sp. PH2017_21_RUC_O_A]
MSEEQLNPPTPEPSQSPTPEVDSPKKSAATSSPAKKTSSAVPTNQGIKGLMSSIGNLGKKGKKLAAEPLSQSELPIAPTASDSATTTPAVAAEVNSAPPPKAAVKFEKKPVSKPTGGSFLQKVGVLWQSIVRLVRDLLPASANAKLSDPILNAGLAAILIVAIGLTLNSFSGKPPQKVAKAPFPAAQQLPPTFDDLVAPGTAKSPEAIANSQPAPTNFKSKLPDLAAPKKPEPVEIIPPPLTPEQSLIAAIQTQVADITNRLGGGLVKSVDADFSIGLLTVKVAEDWYKLSDVEQNQLASQMWKEANSLDFSKLQIANLEGKLIARSPVVGSEMIILERGINKV